MSKLEHQADQIKDEIRDKLRRRLFMLVHRTQFQEILAIQDNLADTAEDIAVLLTIRRLDTPSMMMDEFRRFREVNLRAFRLAESIINELDELMETGFGGAEAEKVRTVIHDIAYTEHQADVLQRSLLKKILSDEAGVVGRRSVDVDSAREGSVPNIQLFREPGRQPARDARFEVVLPTVPQYAARL